MKLYLVRHGESEYNAEELYQPPTSKLSEKGVEQANFLAQRFQSIPVDVIFSSSLTRAKETAEIIAKVIQKEIVYEDLLAEIKRPSEVIGKSKKDPEVIELFKQIDSHADDPNWHYSDEESFTDLKKRAQELLLFIESRQEEHILCVTHGAMLRMIICVMLHSDVSAEFYQRFWNFFRTRNTGITVCDYEDGEWHLVTWNDHAHLG